MWPVHMLCFFILVINTSIAVPDEKEDAEAELRLKELLNPTQWHDLKDLPIKKLSPARYTYLKGVCSKLNLSLFCEAHKSVFCCNEKSWHWHSLVKPKGYKAPGCPVVTDKAIIQIVTAKAQEANKKACATLELEFFCDAFPENFCCTNKQEPWNGKFEYPEAPEIIPRACFI